MQVRDGRATVSGIPAKSDTFGEPLLSVASRKGNEMFLALEFLALLAVGIVCAITGWCAVPFAAIGAVAALNLPRRAGLLLTGAVWFVDQLVGFAFKAYPHDPSTLAWGVGIGVAAFASYGIASILAPRVALAFFGAFVAYEAALMLFSLRLGGWEAYAPNWMIQIFATNLVVFVVAHVVLRLLAKQPVFGVNLNTPR